MLPTSGGANQRSAPKYINDPPWLILNHRFVQRLGLDARAKGDPALPRRVLNVTSFVMSPELGL
ncbi:hypothetical protein N7466_007681 [Penicillium verhagenii]|uniref:uncharacterized protein n=1 Tax=Penicillium verhagenii TaxID=1562060 RepID=UPI00254527E6|nr:uncharacterized protein N7466_007681 [Penicillium verhagenii]KAJ5928725.1 hypothetical protein N7466_007681 [Penicillium verhagenii]